MRTLAVIPCKSMSRRVAGKNFRVLGDKRLYKWTIEAAKKCLGSEGIGKIIISTDKPDLVAPEDQVMVVKRPKHLLDCSAWEVMKYHAKKNPDFDAYMMLQPTSPFRTEKDIAEALIMFKRADNFMLLRSVPLTWETNGAIVIWRGVEEIKGNWESQGIMFFMNKVSSIEVDTEEDFEIAEAIAKHIALPRSHTQSSSASPHVKILGPYGS